MTYLYHNHYQPTHINPLTQAPSVLAQDLTSIIYYCYRLKHYSKAYMEGWLYSHKYMYLYKTKEGA